jgi:hypothetical protein
MGNTRISDTSVLFILWFDLALWLGGPVLEITKWTISHQLRNVNFFFEYRRITFQPQPFKAVFLNLSGTADPSPKFTHTFRLNRTQTN